MLKVLFVCMGNICRSPMAEAVFRHRVAEAGLADQFEIDSAGTIDLHAGAPPHQGTQRILRQQGIDVGSQRSRPVRRSDLDEYDYVVAMDRENLDDLLALSPQARNVSRLLDYAPGEGLRDVSDPYYTGGFDATYRLVDAGVRGLLAHIRQEHGL